MGAYAVFSREMLMLYKKIGRMGYIFSSIISPFIYLFAFGYGLGNRVEVSGGYLPFLAGGIIAITIMVNAFQQTAGSVSVGRMYYHVFQSLDFRRYGRRRSSWASCSQAWRAAFSSAR